VLNNKEILKMSVAYLIGQFLVYGLAFISTPIFSRLMPTEAYGLFDNVIALETILYPILTLNLQSTINRAKYEYAEDNDSFLLSIMVTANIITLVFYLFVEANINYLSGVSNIEIKYIRLFFVYMLFYPAFSFKQIQSTINKEYKLYLKYALISAFSRTIIAIALVVKFEDKFFGRFIGYIVPAILAFIPIYCGIIRNGKKVRVRYAIDALKISVPLLPSALSMMILLSSDRVMITKMVGRHENAIYSIAFSLSAIGMVLATALNQVWAPLLFDSLNEKRYSETNDAAKVYVKIYALMISALIIFSPELIIIMGGDKYIGAIIAVPPILVGLLFQFIYTFYFNVEYFYGRTYIISLGTFIAALMNLGLNYIFIPRYGFVAAAYTTMIGFAFMMLYHYFVVTYVMKKNIFNTQSFIFAIIAVIFIQLITYKLYAYCYIRYTMLGIVFLLTVKEIKEKFFKNA
jgi:O-antigen/teichoic acid export membrane protein